MCDVTVVVQCGGVSFFIEENGVVVELGGECDARYG